MKSKFNLFIIPLLLLSFSCAHNIEKQEQDFVLPSVQKQPRLIYPKLAQQNAFTGNSKITMLISRTGVVEKAFISKSSGYNILDKTALDYCKSIIFSPATRNGVPAEARIEWEIKFDISNTDVKAGSYISKMEWLMFQIKYSDSSEKIIHENELLEVHNEFIQNIKDGLNFNTFISKVISPNITSEWKHDWDAFPLSFLLYHDFLQRYKDYNNPQSVKTLLSNSLKLDIEYIKNTPAESDKAIDEKKNILEKIKKFINREYPDIILEDLGMNRNNVLLNAKFHLLT